MREYRFTLRRADVRRRPRPGAWVLGWGVDVAVLAPTALRDEARDHARRMVERYGDDV